MMVLKPDPNPPARPNLRSNDVESINEMPAKEGQQISYLFQHLISTNAVWTDQGVLRVSMPEGSKLVVVPPSESAIPIEVQTQAGRAEHLRKSNFLRIKRICSSVSKNRTFDVAELKNCVLLSDPREPRSNFSPFHNSYSIEQYLISILEMNSFVNKIFVSLTPQNLGGLTEAWSAMRQGLWQASEEGLRENIGFKGGLIRTIPTANEMEFTTKFETKQHSIATHAGHKI
jgi:hypothetical protein